LAVAPPVGVVFVANGSGDIRSVSANLSNVIAETGAPLQLETCPWSHGWGRFLADQTDHANHVVQGTLLAAQVAAYRQACPGQKVYLVGHSAGCAVVLAAAEALPPGSVERIILLAPSVCVNYDLRPALRCACRGIDSYHSADDFIVLGLGMLVVGTAEGCCRTAAGQFGFTPVIACSADAELYSHLRQHAWDLSLVPSGHYGGHYGCSRPGFLATYVLPLLLCP
jgi:pimeloyl-ACP methyl ester carboxylesterase